MGTRIVFLRGAVPPKNEHPDKIFYDDIDNSSDMWTQLFYYTLSVLSGEYTGELVYQGGKYHWGPTMRFEERHVKSIPKYIPERAPDIIIARGGFDYYEKFLRRYPNAKKIYYGAGRRFKPLKQGRYMDYDLFLVDSVKQLKDLRKSGLPVEQIIKPAADLFVPMGGVEKTYDVCFMANATQGHIKRHALMIEQLTGSGLRVMNIGNTSKEYIRMADKAGVDVTWVGWRYRKDLPKLISQCKVGLCCSTGYDSCPRVIPEYLACGLPVVATKNINFWHDAYITKQTGILVKDGAIRIGISQMLEKDSHDVVRYYRKHLSMGPASRRLAGQIQGIE